MLSGLLASHQWLSWLGFAAALAVATVALGLLAALPQWPALASLPQLFWQVKALLPRHPLWELAVQEPQGRGELLGGRLAAARL